MSLDIPKHLDNIEYQKFYDAFAASKGLDLFERAYSKFRILNGEKLYALKLTNWSQEDKDQLLSNFRDVNIDYYEKKWVIELVAYYFHCHRLICKRKGNRVDDYVKAEYLVAHRDQIEKNPRDFWLTQDLKMEHLIDEVNKIYDTAYLNKINHPELQDTVVFFDAENETLDQKKEIAFLANQRYLWRIEKKIPGDDKADWIYAENKYPEWKAKKQIAELCWLASHNKQKDQDAYWAMASLVIFEFENKAKEEQDAVDKDIKKWIEIDPYDPSIYDYITTIVEQIESKSKQAHKRGRK